MSNEYKIRLGVDLDKAQLNSVKQSIDNISKDRDININIDFNIKDASKLVQVGKDIDDIKAKLKDLNNVGSIGKGKSLISVDAKSVEASLDKINKQIKTLQNSFGKVDKNKGTQSLLTTVNKIRKALEEVSGEFASLNKNLAALSNKNFSLNFDFSMGKNSKSPEQVLSEIKMLEKEAKEYENYFHRYYKLGNRDNVDPIRKLMMDYMPDKKVYIHQLKNMMLSGEPSVKQIAAYKEYIGLIKEAARISPVGIAAESIVKKNLGDSEDFVKVKNEVSETEQKLKELFSGGIDASKLDGQLDSIVQDLQKISQFIDNLTNNNSIDSLVAPFNRLSEALEKVVNNAKLVQNVLGNGFDTNVIGGNTNYKTSTSTRKRVTNQGELDSYLKYWNIKGKDAELLKGKFKAFSEVSSRGVNDELYKTSLNDLITTIKQLGSVSKQADLDMENLLADLRTRNIDAPKDIYGAEFGDDWKSTRARYASILANKNSATRIPVDTAYEELKEQYPAFFPEDIWNPQDQLKKIFEVYDLANKMSKNRQVGISEEYNDVDLKAEVLDIVENLQERTRLEQQAAQSSTQATNTIVDNERRTQQEYEQTLLQQKQRVEEIDKSMEDIANHMNQPDVDMSDLQNYMDNIDTLEKEKTEILANIEQIENALKTFETADVTSDTSGFDKLENDLEETVIEASKAEDVFENMRKQLSNMNFSDSDIDSIIRDIEKLGIVIDRITLSDNGDGLNISIKGKNDLKEAVTYSMKLGDNMEELEVTNKTITHSFEKIANAAEKVKNKFKGASSETNVIGSSGFDKELVNVDAKIQKLANSYPTLETAVDNLKASFENLKLAMNNGSDEEIVAANIRYEESLKRVNNQLDINIQKEKQAAAAEKLKRDRDTFKNDIDAYLKKYSAAAEKYGAQLLQLKERAESCNRVELDGLVSEFKKLDRAIEAAGLKSQTFTDRIKTQIKRYSAYFSVAEVFMYTTQALRDMFDQVVAIDTAMTELKKVTDETESSYNQFLTSAASRAKELGTTIDGLVTSTADFARLGYEFKDAQGLAEVANIYAVVGDDIDSVETATQSLISTLTAFKDEAGDLGHSDFALSIVDKMNEVSNNFAISSGGIGEALQRSASSMMAANNSLDETIALITAANTVVQDPASVGTAFKTISMRIRGAKTELEEAGLETEGMVESTATLRKEIMALSGVDIMANENEFKSTYQIMEELADKWQDLSDIQQATITELIAGKRQGNIVSSLMNNFEIADEALKTSLTSSGSAMAEHEKWQQSLEARLLKLKATWQSLAQSFMSSDFLKVAIDGVISLVEALDKLIGTMGTLPTLTGVFAGALSLFKNKGFLTFDKDVNSIKILGNTLDGLKGKYDQTQTAINRYNSLSSKSSAFQEKYNNVVASSSSSMGKYISGLNGAQATMKGYITYLATSTIKTIGLQVATVALNAAITMGISFAISGLIKLADKLIVTESELAESVKDVTSKFKEQSEELRKNKASFKEEASRYAELSKGVDSLGRNVSLTSDEYSEYKDITNSIANQVPSLVAAYDEEGNAILNCAGNVNELTEAYYRLIEAQNNKIINESSEDIIKDFENAIEDSNNGIGDDISTGGANALDKMLSGTYSKSQISSYLDNLYGENSDSKRRDIVNALKAAGLDSDVDVSWWSGREDYDAYIADAIENHPDVVKKVISNFEATMEEEASGMKTIADAVISNAFDVGETEYSGLSDEMQNLARRIVSGFDAGFYTELVENEDYNGDVEKYIHNMLDAFNEINNTSDAEAIESALNLQMQFNDGELSYGEYVNRIKEIESLINGLDLDEEVKSQIKLALNTDEIINEYDSLFNRLTSEEYGIKLDANSAKSFLNGLNSSEFKVAVDFIENGNKDFNIALQNYKNVLTEAEEAGVNFSKTVYGNINTNARQTLEWTSENLEKYKDKIMSWEAEDANWDEIKKGYENTISTVLGTLSSYEIDGKEVDIAFSPMLQTDNGAELLSSDTVNSYINGLIDKAMEDGSWSNEELLKLDAEGFEVDGQKVKGILADIGETAEATSMQMHFSGKDGAIALAEEGLLEIVEKQAKLDEAMNFTIDVDTDGIEALNSAIGESKSAIGLTSESIETLKSRYQDLDGYDAAKLFEETANGIRINSTELAKLENEYKDFNKQKIDDTLTTLTEEYDRLTEEIAGCTDDQEKLNSLYAERGDILDQINNVASLAAQFEGLTSAYNEWQRAQEAGQDRDPYENILSGKEEIEDEMSRGWLDDAGVEYLELLSGKDLSTAGIDAQIKAYKELDETIGNTGYSVWDFFTQDKEGNSTSDGIYNFFDTVKSMAGETAAWIDENGKYNFDFEGFEYNGKTGDAAIADMLGTSEELVQLILAAAEDAGFVVNIEGDYTDLADAVVEAEKANNRMKELGATTYTFNFDSTDLDNLNEQIGEAKTMLSNLKNEDGTLKVGVSEDDYRQARDIIYSLIYQKQRLDDSAVLHVDTEQAKSDIEVAISKLQDFKEYANTLEVETAVGADTTKVVSDIQTVLEDIGKLDANIKAGLGLDTTEVQTAIDSIQADIKAGVAIKQEDIDVVNSAISSISNEAMVELGLDTTLIDNYKAVEQEANGVVNWDNNIEKVTAWINQNHTASGTVNWDDDTSRLKTTYTGKGIVYWNAEVNGTANVNGTTGRAFKQGSWGIKGSGDALGGELGMETLVRDGRFYTIGDNGAEFFKYKQGDIIFNHKQTEELFKNGKVTSGGGRGRVFANGSAFSGGSDGGGSLRDTIKNAVDDAVKEAHSAKTTDTNTGGTGSSGTGTGRNTIKDAVTDSSSSDSDKEEKEFKEKIDWIEVAIDRLERAIDSLDKKATNVYKSWSSRNEALVDEIGLVNDEISLQQSAYEEYMEEANSVGLSEDWAEKVRNGEIDIETITDEDLKEKIEEYQSLYEKALDCQEAIENLTITEAELYAQRFENVQSEYEGILQGFEHTENMINEYISQAEERGYIVSQQYYQSLIDNELANIDELKKEQAELIAKRDEAVASGAIEEGSEEWINMSNDIDEVTQAIEESTTAVIEFNNAIRDIDWQVFDLVQQRISEVTEEADFFIDLMSNKKLFEDDGKMTSEGVATMGLHAQNYNTYMYQADEYGAEIASLDEQIAADPYNQTLIDRRNEVLGLQRESILAAEEEKNAIVNMVEEGINLELDALQERIDKYNEALDSQKDLYEYQKKVKKQTEEIASLEKQIASYSGDDSEEAKAKVQELKVSLEDAEAELQETEYDKYISDQQALLDTLYTEYELILNQRLDNIDALLTQVIDSINAVAGVDGVIMSALGSEGAISIAIGDNATSIKTTLETAATNVGTTLSTAMSNIWTTDGTGTNSVLATYGQGFQDKQTTTNGVLNDIKVGVNTMVAEINKEAEEQVSQNKTTTSAQSNPTTSSGSTSSSSNTSTSSSSSSGDGNPKVGDKVKFVNGKYYYDSYGTNPAGSYKQGGYVYITHINKSGTHPYHISTGNKLGSGDLGWLKLSQISGYATGNQNFTDDEIAWTQENGQEFIVRPSDGAILTPIARGDSVLNTEASNNIWNMANSPSEFIKSNLGLGESGVPNNSTTQTSYTQNLDNVVFSFPNVKNYDEFISEMQKDKNFERLIQSMTTDRLVGGSSLAKNKSIR